MEKQLLLLLDFDLRISSVDLDWAASLFYPTSTPQFLIPTTPNPMTLRVSHMAAESVISKQKASESSKPCPINLGVKSCVATSSRSAMVPSLHKLRNCYLSLSSISTNGCTDDEIMYEDTIQHSQNHFIPISVDTQHSVEQGPPTKTSQTAPSTTTSFNVDQQISSDGSSLHYYYYPSAKVLKLQTPRNRNSPSSLLMRSASPSKGSFSTYNPRMSSDAPIRPSPKKRAIPKAQRSDVPYLNPVYPSFNKSSNPASSPMSSARSQSSARDISQVTLSCENAILSNSVRNLDLFKSTPGLSTVSLAGTLVSCRSRSPSDLYTPQPGKPFTANTFSFGATISRYVTDTTLCSRSPSNNAYSDVNVIDYKVPTPDLVPAQAKDLSKDKTESKVNFAHISAKNWSLRVSLAKSPSLNFKSKKCVQSTLKAKLFTPISTWFRTSRNHPYINLSTSVSSSAVIINDQDNSKDIAYLHSNPSITGRFSPAGSALDRIHLVINTQGHEAA